MDILRACEDTIIIIIIIKNKKKKRKIFFFYLFCINNTLHRTVGLENGWTDV